jgi:hypothetical protein
MPVYKTHFKCIKNENSWTKYHDKYLAATEIENRPCPRDPSGDCTGIPYYYAKHPKHSARLKRKHTQRCTYSYSSYDYTTA